MLHPFGFRADLSRHFTLSQEMCGSNPDFIANLKRLAASGLLLESANPNPVLIADILKLTDRVPELRIVIDHLPQALPPTEPSARKAYEHDLQALSRSSNVFVKGSEVLRQVDGKVPADLDFYRPWLDEIWENFGEDRLLYGSDWPNSDHLHLTPAHSTLSGSMSHAKDRRL